MGRKKERKQRKLLSAAGLLLLFISVVLTAGKVQAKEPEHETIKIGYIDYEGFIDRKEDGTYGGYGVEYLEEIAKYTDWEYEYVYDTFSNQLENLKNGSIDFICHAQKTEEREEEFLFSKYSTGAESSILYVNKEDERYYFNDFKSFDGMNIGLLENSYQNEVFAEYAKEKNFTYQVKEYPVVEQCFQALKAGEVDAVAVGSLGMNQDFKAVCKFGSDPFYFMTGKMNRELLDELDDALGQIAGVDPYFQADLYEKYYGDRANAEILFTREEADYIRESGAVTVGLIADREPLSSQKADGTAWGMTVDLMELAAKKTGLTFEYEFLGTGETGMQYLTESENAKLVAGVMQSDFSVPNPELVISDSLQEGTISFVGKKGYDFTPEHVLTVAVGRGFIGGEEVIRETYPNFQIYHVEDDEAGLDAILDGKADVVLQNSYVVGRLLQNPKYDELERYPAYSFEESMRVVALPEDEMLISVINKAIRSFTDEEKNEIIMKNTVSSPYEAALSDLLYKYRYPIAGFAVLILACMALLIAIAVIKQRNLTVLEKKNAQLAEAVAQADNANLAKSQFLARMSHEIRTPMNAIVGLTNLAEHHTAEPERVSEYLRKIDTSSAVLLNIINDVLDMSAIESNKIKIAMEPFHLEELLSSISTIYYSQCKQKGVHFEMQMAGVVHHHLIGDKLRLNQILLNLVSNACKFTPSGGSVKVTAEELSERDGKAYIAFNVEDTGEGMEKEMLERLFRPFEQESAGTARKHGGSGLGLSIAKNLVELMSGAIAVESEKGKGSKFMVSIPFVIDKNAYSEEEQGNGQRRILIVDEDPESRNYTVQILKRLRAGYDTAKDAEDAMQKLSEAEDKGNAFTVCLVDYKEETAGGTETVKQIRKLFGKESLVIAAAAYDTAEIREDAEAAGVDLFVSKPLFQSELFNLLLQVTGGKYLVRKPEDAAYDFGGKRILLAEDVEFNAQIVIELMDMVNIRTDRAADGEEAVEMFLRSGPGTYAGIFMDIQMPKKNGYEAAKEIRSSSHPDAKKILIYAMTANAFSEDISEALNSGMNGHISKPIDHRILYGTIREMIAAQDETMVSQSTDNYVK